ncbi:hypothetical protein P278_15880 [Zhouia amylolytica AD3]|uniref:Uncharacterized protein n=1 Tax=Zhouia amylolytica AD3 TaxID=1286632 RepID=W2UQW6_9FLAO|nr:hypothetical protein P278_15880 [Zhouia amylolytica AD3]
MHLEGAFVHLDEIGAPKMQAVLIIAIFKIAQGLTPFVPVS